MAMANGHHNQTDTSSQFDINMIIQALQVVHESSSKHDSRREATAYLEDVKSKDGVAEVGFAFANDTSQQPIVRYYGLDLLEHVIKRQVFTLDEQRSAQLRDLVLRLSLTLSETSQPFIRNKIGALWVELAKRSWALDWFDLDEALQQLWSRSDIEKAFVLYVLENLSEDVFVRDDTTAIIRDKDLNNAVVEIFTSQDNYTGGLKIGNSTYRMRYGTEGWATRITGLLSEHRNGITTAETRRLCLAALNTVRSMFFWIMSPAIISAAAMSVVCDFLTQSDTDIILAAIDALLSFYSRKVLEDIEIHALIHPFCHPASVGALEQVYKWSIVGPDETLDPRYAISKKLSELLFHFASGLAGTSPPEDVDLVPFLTLLINVAQHDSLIVSIAAVHSWHKLIESWAVKKPKAIEKCIQPILQVAMQRILAYDMLPADTDEAAVLFVNDEIELYPERQGFYLNYRRLCFAIIEWIGAAYRKDALGFILTSADRRLQEIAEVDAQNDNNNYERVSANMLHADATFSVTDAAFKGIYRYVQAQMGDGTQEPSDLGEENGEQSLELIRQCKEWSMSMLSRYQFRDPGTTLRQIKTAVENASKLLKTDTEFAFAVLQHIIASMHTPQTGNAALAESYSELHQFAIQELRRLCSEHATYFITFYDQLETKLGQIINSGLEQKYQIDLKAILMLLVEHADGLDDNIRLERLKSFVNPLLDVWHQQESALSTFESFAHSQAFDQVGPLMASINAGKMSDWTVVSIGSDAERVQAAMADGASKLPLRETRVLLSMSTDRITPNSTLQQILCEVWVPLLRTIITSILRLVSYNHQLHNPASWPNLSSDQHLVVQRILRDRYWQSGISGGSMQEFHERVKSTKTTLEGFASSVRGRIRANLESCYSIIHTLGRLGSSFYSIPELPSMVAEALLISSQSLSPHHFGLLLSMVPKLVEECPQDDMQHFLTPVLAELTTQIDRKCTAEWEKMNARGSSELSREINGDLSDEMRDESVLRQMTSKAVNLVTSWIDVSREQKLSNSKRIVNKLGSSFRTFVLGNRMVLEPLLMFCTHAIGYKDTKTCSTMAPAMQKFVPAFSTNTYLQGSDAVAVREFISTEMLKAAINSLNDGYFADYQQHLSILIAIIWISLGLPTHVAATDTKPAHDRPAWTGTPRNILLSIPGIDPAQVDRAGIQLAQVTLAGKQKVMKAVILKLLENVRGVRVSELGKIDNRQERSRLLEKYKQRDALGMQGIDESEKMNGESGIDLGGVADMFG